MATDLNLIGYRYNIILSIFFVVYLRLVVSSSHHPIGCERRVPASS